MALNIEAMYMTILSTTTAVLLYNAIFYDYRFDDIYLIRWIKAISATFLAEIVWQQSDQRYKAAKYMVMK